MVGNLWFQRAALLAGLVLVSGAVFAQGPASTATGGVLDHQFRQLAVRETVDLRAAYGGDVVLIVNTASKCGFTPQYEALESMHARLRPRGFAVLGFPSGDFNEQEFDDEAAIQEFCTLTYGVKFPMFQKVHVTGPDTTPMYRQLAQATGQAPEWNFHKYLVGRDGRILGQWGSSTKPDAPEILAAIQRALDAPRPAAR